MSVDTFDDDDQDDIASDDPAARYRSVYDGLTGFGPGGDGRSWAAKGGHPPLYCPNPRFQPNARGLYFCPCCGEKIRHHTHVTAAEWAAETVEPALAQAWDIVWPSLKTLTIWTALAIAWLARAAWNIVNRHRQEDPNGNVERRSQETPQEHESHGKEEEESGGAEPAEPAHIPENDRPVTCITSDGIHVVNTSNGQDKCFVCGTAIAGKGNSNQ